MDRRTERLKRQIRDFGLWSHTNIRAWAIFDENGLPLFVEGEELPLGDQLEVALGAITSNIDDIVQESGDYGLSIKLATFEMTNRDKLHYFRMENMSLVIITEYNIRGEEEFLKNVTESIERLKKAFSE